VSQLLAEAAVEKALEKSNKQTAADKAPF